MTENKPSTSRPTRRDTYSLPMFLGALIGGLAQWAALEWPDFRLIVFLTMIVLIMFFVGAFNRR